MTDRGQNGGPNPDWSRLPAEFTYLADAARRYGAVVTPDGRLTRRLTRKEREELGEIAKKIGWHNHELPLESWVIANISSDPDGLVHLVNGLGVILVQLGYDVSDFGPKEEPQWTLQMWGSLHHRVLWPTLLEHTREIFTDEQTLDIIFSTLERVPKADLAWTALLLLHAFGTPRALDWIERSALEDVGPDWGYLAAVSGFGWPRAERWLRRGRPLSLIALDALRNMEGKSESPIVEEANPKLCEPPPFDRAAQVLRAYAARDPVPRVERAVESVLKRWLIIIGEEKRKPRRGDSPDR
jgi:hypothetical protein